MSNENFVELGVDSTKVVSGVASGISSLDEFINKMVKVDAILTTLTKSTTSSLDKMLKQLDASLGESVTGITAAQRNAGIAVAAGNREALVLVKAQNNALQVAYEQRLATQGVLQNSELQHWKNLRVNIGKIQDAQLAGYKIYSSTMQMFQREHIAKLEQNFAREQVIPPAGWGYGKGYAGAQAKQNIAALEAQNTEVLQAKLAFNKFYANVDNARIAQDIATQATIRAETVAFYTQMEEAALVNLAAARAIAIQYGVVAKARIDQNIATQATIRAETVAFYTQMEEAALVNLAAARVIAIQHGVVAKARIDQDIATQATIRAETVAFYTQMEEAALVNLAAA
ncbi:MAG: hypothetical protein QX189_18060, partial [Methylococcales bacterium]